MISTSWPTAARRDLVRRVPDVETKVREVDAPSCPTKNVLPASSSARTHPLDQRSVRRSGSVAPSRSRTSLCSADCTSYE